MAESQGHRFPAQLEEAVTLVALEAPTHFAAMRRQLGALAGVIRVGQDPPINVCVAHGPPWVRPSAEGDIELSLSVADLSRLLRGELTIEEGILGGQLSARGALGHLIAFLDGLASWLHGALRCPSLPRLYERFFADQASATNGDEDIAKRKGLRPC